ncbi:hypothetical protein HWI79_2968 [Cryptosporidium felis]|nr:hypothetical protein HWI79_2968 [Cryptosporidium felis]
MNGPADIPEILKIGGVGGSQKFSIERLRDISICLSSLNGDIRAPIFEVLIEQEDLQKGPSEYKSLLVNCLIDCIRLALPFSPDYLGQISSRKNFKAFQSSKGGRKQTSTQIITGYILSGLSEHIEALVKEIGKGGEESKKGLRPDLAAYIYSIQRVSEDNGRVMVFLLENIADGIRTKNISGLFDKFLTLYENSLDGKATHITKICRDAIASMLVYSGSVNLKSELVLALLLKVSRLISVESEKKAEFFDNTNFILLKVGVSGISYFTNAILTESVRFLRKGTLPSIEPGRKKEGTRCWWRDESLLIPGFIRGNKNQKEQDIKKILIELVHFLWSLNEEFVQSILTQLICDLKDDNDKLRLETVKMVTRLIILSFKPESDFNRSPRIRGSETNQQREFGSKQLKEKLLESWLSRANDRSSDIRAQVFLGLEEIVESFQEKSDLGGYFKTLIKFILDYGHISCPNTREKMLVVISSWVTANKQNGGQESDELMENCVQYLLNHLCDRNRSIRIYLIKYFKGYCRLPEVSRNLWLLWYVSFKQEDFQMRNIIEDVILELDQFEVLGSYLSQISINQESPESSNTNKMSAEKKSSSTIYKIAKTFYSQRFSLLKGFKLFVLLVFIDRFNQKIDLVKCISAFKRELSKQIEYFFSGGEDYSRENSAKRADELLTSIQSSLKEREDFLKWGAILGLSFHNTTSNTETQGTIFSLVSSNSPDSLELTRIVRFINLLDFGDQTAKFSLLHAIFVPNLADPVKIQSDQVKTEHAYIDNLCIMIISTQFQFEINVINYLLNSSELVETRYDKIIEKLEKATSIYNHLEVYKIYEGYYLNSKTHFNTKLLKYFGEINRNIEMTNFVLSRSFMKDGFFYQEGARDCFISEILHEDRSDLIYRDMICQIFPNSPNLLDSFCSYFKILDFLESSNLTEEGADLQDRCLDSFILRLEAEKTRKSEFSENPRIYLILKRLVRVVEELSRETKKCTDRHVKFAKLARIATMLFPKIDPVDEALFSDFFALYYNLNIERAIAKIERNQSNSAPESLLNLEKRFFSYLAKKTEEEIQGTSFTEENATLQESLYIFNVCTFFELVRTICFSEMKEFFKKNHFKLFELANSFDNGDLQYFEIIMISKILVPQKTPSNSILTTTLGRSLGIFFIPILGLKASSGSKLQKVTERREKVIQNTLGVLFSSAMHANGVNLEKLHCILDCIFAAFLYYTSKSYKYDNELINMVVHAFANSIHIQLSERLSINSSGERSSTQLRDIGLYSIALLEELSSNYHYESECSQANRHESDGINISEYCRGLQFHFSYFFVNRTDPLVYRRRDTDYFDRWNYIQSTSEFKIPSYLFSKVDARSYYPSKSPIWSIPNKVKRRVGEGHRIKASKSKRAKRIVGSEESSFSDSDPNDENYADNSNKKCKRLCPYPSEPQEDHFRPESIGVRRSNRLKALNKV